MTIRETSEILGLKVRTIRDWVHKGKLRAVKKGKSWYIYEEEVHRKETIERAIKSREHSRRIKAGKEMGMLQRERQNTEESI